MRIYLARVRKGGELLGAPLLHQRRAYVEPVTRTVVYTTPAVYAPAPMYVAVLQPRCHAMRRQNALDSG